jgi:hypothetical protein
MQTDLGRGGQLVVFSVSDVNAALGHDAEALTCEMKDTRVRFLETLPAGENGGIN